MRTPVAFIIFNRPDLTARVFGEIARARPPKLLVIADGPRPGEPGEEKKCAATRAIIDRVDWQCEVLKNYSETNMGCGRRPATGLSWIFHQVEEAIILEDDCLPHPTFFRFCEELLEKYRNDERVMHISGDNFLHWKKRARSYFFSSYSLSWGWATWRRAFRYYDPEIKQWPSLRNTEWLHDILEDPIAVKYFRSIFDMAHAASTREGYWDYQWLFTLWARGGLAILPGTNLVSNIGYRADATHTKPESNGLGSLPVSEMTFPLKHPAVIARDKKLDQAIFERITSVPRPTIYRRLRRKCVAAMPTILRRSLSAMSVLWSNLGRHGRILVVCSATLAALKFFVNYPGAN